MVQQDSWSYYSYVHSSNPEWLLGFSHHFTVDASTLIFRAAVAVDEKP
jgi:hypothetical protein